MRVPDAFDFVETDDDYDFASDVWDHKTAQNILKVIAMTFFGLVAVGLLTVVNTALLMVLCLRG